MAFNNPDEYIASFPSDVQEILEKVRSTIKSAAPGASEKMGYGVAAFVLKNGKKVYYAAFKNHVGFYPSPAIIQKFQRELSGYKQARGTIQFQLNEPIPYDLIGKMIKEMENGRD